MYAVRNATSLLLVTAFLGEFMLFVRGHTVLFLYLYDLALKTGHNSYYSQLRFLGEFMLFVRGRTMLFLCLAISVQYISL